MKLRLSTALGPLALGACAVLLLAGCTQAVSLDAAPDAANPECAEVTVRLPDTVAGQSMRQTDAQATGAWGDPATILLRCGVPIPGPTTAHCVSANGIDWVIDDSDAPQTLRYTTFGRAPATEIVIDHTEVSDATVLADLAEAIKVIPQTKKCLAIGDTVTPTPTRSG